MVRALTLDDPQWIDATWRSLYIGGATAVAGPGAGACRCRSAWCAASSRAGCWSIGWHWRLSSLPTIILSVAVYGLFAKLKLIGAWYGLVVGAQPCWRCPFVVLVMTAGLRDFRSRAWSRQRKGLGGEAASARSCASTLPLLRPSPRLGRTPGFHQFRSTSSWWHCSWRAPT